MALLEQAFLFSISLVANILSAMAGGGAGLLQLPALLFLGLPFSVALATHKIATVALGVGASLQHARAGHVHWPFALMILAAGLPGVVLGARIILDIPDVLAEWALGILTISLGIYSVFKPQLGHQFTPQHRTWPGLILGALVLFLLGILNGSLASGTGLFVTLWLIAWFGFDFKRATAYTLLLVGLFWNGAGALTLAFLSPVKWAWLPALLAGSLLGGFLGARIAVNRGNVFIKRVFEIATLLVGASLIVKNL